MITRAPDGEIEIVSDDWSGPQMALGALIDRLPVRPGGEDCWIAAIERLGDTKIRALLPELCDAVDELAVRPTEIELMEMVKAIRTVQSEVAALRHRGFPRLERPRRSD